jgi:hypothetical protein
LVTAISILIPILAGCGKVDAQGVGAPAGSIVPVNDTILFAAVVRHATSNANPFAPYRIDPHPLKADPTITAPTLKSLADVPREVVELRRAVLIRMGIVQTDAVEDFKCPGIDIPPPGMEPRHRVGCPEVGAFTSVSMGLPRPGGPYWPNASVAGGMVQVPDVDEREPGLSLGYWSVRLIRKQVDSTGGSHSVRDLVFKRDPKSGAWTFVAEKVFYIAD